MHFDEEVNLNYLGDSYIFSNAMFRSQVLITILQHSFDRYLNYRPIIFSAFTLNIQ